MAVELGRCRSTFPRLSQPAFTSARAVLDDGIANNAPIIVAGFREAQQRARALREPLTNVASGSVPSDDHSWSSVGLELAADGLPSYLSVGNPPAVTSNNSMWLR